MITKKTKIFVASSILGFCIVLVGLFFILKYIYTQGEEVLHQAEEVANYAAREQSYRDLSQLVEETKGDRDTLLGHILTEDNTIEFLSTIEQIALEQGIELTTNTLKVIQGEGLFDTLAISFEVEGAKPRVYAVLQILETLPQHALVSKISLQTPVDAQAETVRGTIELTASLLQYDR
jgi:hypothetical protein